MFVGKWTDGQKLKQNCKWKCSNKRTEKEEKNFHIWNSLALSLYFRLINNLSSTKERNTFPLNRISEFPGLFTPISSPTTDLFRNFFIPTSPSIAHKGCSYFMYMHGNWAMGRRVPIDLCGSPFPYINPATTTKTNHDKNTRHNSQLD